MVFSLLLRKENTAHLELTLCLEQQNQYGDSLRDTLLRITVDKADSLWFPACSQHTVF